MKNKLIVFSIFFFVLFLAINYYIVNFYCGQDKFCIYRLSDGLFENLAYLSGAFLISSILTLIGNKKYVWMSIFFITTVITMLTPQTCSGIICYSRETLLFGTISVTLFIALATNLYGRFKK